MSYTDTKVDQLIINICDKATYDESSKSPTELWYVTDENITFVYTQGVPASTWYIEHNLGKNPSITVVDSANSVVQGDYEYNDINHCTLKFEYPFTGKAFLN